MTVFTETSRPIVNALPKSLIKHPNLFYLKNSVALINLQIHFMDVIRDEIKDWPQDKVARIATLMAWSAFLDRRFPGANTYEAFIK